MSAERSAPSAPDFSDAAQYGGTFSRKRPTPVDYEALARKYDLTVSDKPPAPSSGVKFEVDIQNVTASDITIPADLKVLSQTRETHALKETVLRLEGTYFIPARHTVSVSLSTSGWCAADWDSRQCFNAYFGQADALDIFDGRSRYEMVVPMPVLTTKR